MSYVLVVAASDSSGGAGLSRDVEVLGAMGVRAAPALSAITVQSDTAVVEVSEVAPRLIAQQMKSALRTRSVGAVKVGALMSAEAVAVVANTLGEHPGIPVVVDPVVSSSSGRRFLDARAIEVLKTDLLQRASVVTPNLPELAELDGLGGGPKEQALRLECKAVLVKGGHAGGDRVVDWLLHDGGWDRLESARVPGVFRGTGCMLSSAIAGHLSLGEPLLDACRSAKAMLVQSLSSR